MKVASLRIRASYPNYYMVQLYAHHGQEIFNHDSEDPANTLEGNKPGTVIYRLEGEDESARHEFPPRWYDMYRLLKLHGDEKRRYLEMLLEENETHKTPLELEWIRNDFQRECIEYVRGNHLHDGPELVNTLAEGDFTDEEISYKGRMLLDLTRNSYPVPDFCILTSKAFTQPERLPELIEAALSDLEAMTNCKLGDSKTPLVFAIRCAMPQYIPGLMPTLLNVGVTRTAYNAMMERYGAKMASRVYLSTLRTIAEMLDMDKNEHSDVNISHEDQLALIEKLQGDIMEKDDRLLTDALYQSQKLIMYVRKFYIDNADLILTFMQGKQAYPSFILQRMVWTIGNDGSYPGVLYSRHSRTGVGKQIESYRNIFGEEIMTGDVTTEDLGYLDRNEIRLSFPAVYHFDPLLKKLEYRYKTPVTIEFAVESRPHSLSLFSVLQLNASEMTGRAALVSAIDMRNAGLINDSEVMELIKPYHLRQIISSAIDDRSIKNLQFFSNGLSVLPRTAISARLCFSVAKCREYKENKENVCLCQQHFVPEDTITLNEVEAILSIMPAAIHVVTACRGYGIPAIMDLKSYGVSISADGKALVNSDGQRIEEGDMVTISSKRQSIYKGKADFKPARFTKYIQGQPVDLTEDERSFFIQMHQAYRQYQRIAESQQALNITNLSTLARLIRLNLKGQPKKAGEIVNAWYQSHTDEYMAGVLKSQMGDHNDQSRIFDLMTTANKIDFIKHAHMECHRRGVTGLTAGSFMLGRFIANQLPVEMWRGLNESDVAFILNEYILYQKYIQVLQEVGEIRLARAHSRIETEGIDNMAVSNFDLMTFIPLLQAGKDWKLVSEELEKMEHQDNTHLLVERLSETNPEERWGYYGKR